ncbi:methyltransferase domain-containing protein (plasmid) [Streptomyces sp. BI20]|uniref:methyltransferase domain-containing protein n=1 Tax=Streptomyces sp. BI20 TaxID=3403460 RepID=UPI003C72CF9E
MVESVPAIRRLRAASYDAVPEGRGVDVGCGRGSVVAELRARGRDAVGVDAGRDLVAGARARYPGCAFEVGNAVDLPFPDGSLAWYRAERLYLHLPDPRRALAEALRVLEVGGRLVSVEPDMSSVVVSSGDPAVSRAILDAYPDSMLDGRVGSRMPDLVREAGFGNVTCAAVPVLIDDLALATPTMIDPPVTAALAAGSVDTATVRRWYAELERQQARGTFLIACLFFLTRAERP